MRMIRNALFCRKKNLSVPKSKIVCMYVCAILLIGCSNTADNQNPEPVTGYDKTTCQGYVDEVSFTMQSIPQVTNGFIGDDSVNNNKKHTANLTPYHIGTTEVTQELWQAIMGKNPSHFQGADKLPKSGEVQEKRPVENINWFECIAFCNELTKKVNGGSDSECVYYLEDEEATVYTIYHARDEKNPIQKMEKKGFRLPTSAEWTWAAQGGDAHQKYAGTDDITQLDKYAWHKDSAENKTHQVGLKTKNGFGLYDMSGNVTEWCWDYFHAATPADGQTDPDGGGKMSNRTSHGSSWTNTKNNNHCPIAYRILTSPTSRTYQRGLRIVCRP